MVNKLNNVKSKITSQTVALEDEIDDITRCINSKVDFTDIEGYISDELFVISESFANKIKTYYTTVLYLNKKSNLYITLMEEYENGNELDLNILKLIFPKTNVAILMEYKNVKIDKIDDVDINNVRVFVSWKIPFKLCDKITSKYVCKSTV